MSESNDATQHHDPADWRGYFASLTADGVITSDQENELLRFFHELQVHGEAEMLEISTEYNRRRNQDGKPDADTWLQIQAMAMGKRHRESIEKLLTGMGIPVPERNAPSADQGNGTAAAAEPDVTTSEAEDAGSGREWLRTEDAAGDKRPTRRPLRPPQRR